MSKHTKAHRNPRPQTVAIFWPVCRILILNFSAVSLAGAAIDFAETTSFSRHVRPILSNHCFTCHGPNEENRQADMRLDIPDHTDFDELLARITSTDSDEVMPPPETHKELNSEQIEILQRWISSGAPYGEHWSFVPPRAQETPPTKNVQWSQQTIDRFALARMEQDGLGPSPPADQRTLIRRVAFDLTGLPPTLDEIQEFLSDESDNAYENLVDRLMAKPQYGEHMARYWLDLVRFADTNGLHHDHYREMSPYRDWVIRAFNENLRFDDFILFQIAGDLYPDPSLDQQIASGFNRLHLIIDVGTALPEESFTRNVVDRVSAVGTAFLGLTLQCAVCHDHKYDPISQRDFYQLYAFFNNFDGEPETGSRGTLEFRRGLQPPYLNLPSPAQEEERKRLDLELAEWESELETLTAEQPSANDEQTSDQSTNDSSATAESEKAAAKEALSNQIAAQRKLRDAYIETIPATLVMRERAEVRPTHILVRGDYDHPGENVERDTPAFLPPMKTSEDVKNRMDLAEWMVAPGHPLTARVTVNRLWQQFFGVGLVKTSEDFGAQGEWPSHPELLDRLATDFVRSHWNIKSLVRSMVLSNTYRQSSQATHEQYIADPENRLLTRGSRFRLDAEVIRDQVLAVSGLLNPTMYGKSRKTPQPAGLWKTVTMPSSYPAVYEADKGDQIYRRSVYTFWKRGLPSPQMTIFDAPTRESCVARRERTNTPLQALLLMNEEEFFSATMHHVQALRKQSKLSDDQKINRAYEMITSRVPSDRAMVQLKSSLQEFQRLYQSDPAAAKAMVTSSHDPEVRTITDSAEQVKLASWTMLVHSIFNLDITKTHE